mgnify:FL=1
MALKRFIFLLIFSLPLCATVSPNEFIENFISKKDHGEIFKIELLIFENKFLDEVDLKEKWKLLDPLILSEGLFSIKDKPTLLVKKPIFKEEVENNFIQINLENSNPDSVQIEEINNIKVENVKNFNFNFFERIPYDNELEELKNKLDRSSDYQVLHSISWYQPLVEKEKSVSIYVENSNNQTKTYGQILIYKDRYLHFDTKLRLSEKTESTVNNSTIVKTSNFNELLKSKSKRDNNNVDNSYWVQTIFNNIKVNIGDFSNWVLNSDDNDYLIDLNYENNLENYFEDLYEINQEVKIEENQYHFIDHPYFGIIVRISSV